MMDGRRLGGRIKKRKADSQDSEHNERLSKRLSLLNLDRNGLKDAPTELASLPSASKSSKIQEAVNQNVPATSRPPDTDAMQVDNTAHRVYIHSIDDELSDGESSSDEGKILFPAHIRKHLLETRIPQSIRVNADGDFAGVHMSNELVLYDLPTSLTVSVERDSVRKAIIETRARARETQRREREAFRTGPVDISAISDTSSSPERRGRPSWVSTLLSDREAVTHDDVDAMDLD